MTKGVPIKISEMECWSDKDGMLVGIRVKLSNGVQSDTIMSRSTHVSNQVITFDKDLHPTTLTMTSPKRAVENKNLKIQEGCLAFKLDDFLGAPIAEWKGETLPE